MVRVGAAAKRQGCKGRVNEEVAEGGGGDREEKACVRADGMSQEESPHRSEGVQRARRERCSR